MGIWYVEEAGVASQFIIIARSAYYFRTGPFGKMCPDVWCVEISWVLPTGIWRCDRGFSRMVLWPEKRPHYFSGPKSYHQLRTFSTGIGPKRDPKTGPSFSTFLNFVASKSHFFERRTSSHVGWVVIIRWRLRAPCLQVLSSFINIISNVAL